MVRMSLLDYFDFESISVVSACKLSMVVAPKSIKTPNSKVFDPISLAVSTYSLVIGFFLISRLPFILGKCWTPREELSPSIYGLFTEKQNR